MPDRRSLKDNAANRAPGGPDPESAADDDLAGATEDSQAELDED